MDQLNKLYEVGGIYYVTVKYDPNAYGLDADVELDSFTGTLTEVRTWFRNAYASQDESKMLDQARNACLTGAGIVNAMRNFAKNNLPS